MSNRDGKNKHNVSFRKGQKCPRCGHNHPKARLEICGCGCHSKTALYCKTCKWSNY